MDHADQTNEGVYLDNRPTYRIEFKVKVRKRDRIQAEKENIKYARTEMEYHTIPRKGERISVCGVGLPKVKKVIHYGAVDFLDPRWTEVIVHGTLAQVKWILANQDKAGTKVSWELDTF